MIEGLVLLLLKMIELLQALYQELFDLLLCQFRLYLVQHRRYINVTEERFNVLKIIKPFMNNIGKSAIIIDHDLIFLDYFSENMMVFIGMPAVEGSAFGPYSLNEGMNLFLKDLGVSFRRDLNSRKSKTNKEGSKIDRMQKEKGDYFY